MTTVRASTSVTVPAIGSLLEFCMQLVQADNLESISQLLAQRANELNQKSFVIDGPITLSYQDMLNKAQAMGAWLI